MGTTMPPTARAAAVADSPAQSSDWGNAWRAQGRNRAGRPPAERISGASRMAAMIRVSRQIPAGVGPCWSSTTSQRPRVIWSTASVAPFVWSTTARSGPAAMPTRMVPPAAVATSRTIAGRSLT